MTTEYKEVSESEKASFETTLTELRMLILDTTKDENTADIMIESVMNVIFSNDEGAMGTDKQITEEDAVADVMVSGTFSKITALSAKVESNIKPNLSSCIYNLCLALDKEQIHFEAKEDEAVLLRLLAIGLATYFDGKTPIQILKPQ